jgi:hypothetical protein
MGTSCRPILLNLNREGAKDAKIFVFIFVFSLRSLRLGGLFDVCPLNGYCSRPSGRMKATIFSWAVES